MLALSIIALISTGSLFSMSKLSNSQQLDASIINQAGRQRMLSQRIALGVGKYINQLQRNNPASQATRSMIRESSNLMLSSHNGLIASTSSDEVEQLYYSGDPSLDMDVREYVSAALSILNAKTYQQLNPDDLLNFELENINYLLFRLNIVVSAYEEAAEKKVDRSLLAGVAIWALIIITLILEYLYIFKPTLRLIRQGFDQQAIKEKRMQLAADSAKLGIWEFSLRDQSLNWDNRMWQIFYDSEPLKASADLSIFENRLHPDDKEFVMENFKSTLEHHDALDITFRIITPNQNLKHIHAYSTVEFDRFGNALRIVGTNKDITDAIHKKEALIEQRNRAEAATRIKGEFLASMSHEIRTPLNGVMGMLGLLKNTQLSEQQLMRVNVAQSCAQSLLALINDILDFSKIEADKLQIEVIDFDLNALLAEIIDGLAQLAEERGVELVLDTVNVEASHVSGDPGRIRQLLTNLLANAIKFTHEGHVVLSVSLISQSKENWTLHFSIEDTGIGIPAEKIKDLFNAFSQVDASTTRKYGGTGLGLAIVKRLCESMGGDIDVTSQENRGSRFFGSIIIGKSDQSELVAPKYDVSKLHILVVDDNSVNLSILCEQLKHWGIQVSAANSGKHAIHLCEQRALNGEAMFDIAMLDMQMPEMDGADLGRQLKQDTRFSSMHLVMMTSMLMDNDSQTLADMGFSAYFAKPVTTSDIFLTLSVLGENGEVLRQAKPLITHDFLISLNTEENDPAENIKSRVARLTNNHVLLVEDNSINQMVATDLLEEMGFVITTAENGIHALTVLNANHKAPFCLILMDCQMPKMDGFEATKNIRNGMGGTVHMDTPIIALTANTMKGDKQKCLDAGMNDFIPKPFEVSELERVLLTWLT